MARTLTLCLVSIVLSALAVAQEGSTRAEQIRQQRAKLAAQPVESDEDSIERAIEWAYERKLLTLFSHGWRGLTPIFGGLMNQQGFALGAQFLRRDLRDGNVMVRSSARGSMRSASLLDAEFGFPHIARDKMFLDVYARHRRNPGVSFYGIGPDTKRDFQTNYLMEDLTADVTLGARPTNWLRLGVTGGYLATNVGAGQRNHLTSTHEAYTPAQVPGLHRQSDFVRGGVLAHVDWRDNPYGPRAGGQYYGRFDYYDDRNGGGFSFRRLTAEVQQFVPLFNQKRTIALRGKTILSYPSPGQVVPFYLLPSLGSSDDLRGFRPFRYMDRNSFVMNAEWRWEIMSYVEGALFADAGKVFPRPGMINFTGLQKSYGGGLRFRAPGTNAMIFRLDVGASREGVQIWFVFNDIFAAPQVRTGRELSPPTGRLP